ncbi:precorrin-2 C(20)-methyltransferase [Halanaerocella petrolearia]
MVGKLYGLGVGPGDPELITLKTKRILEEVDLICTPQSKRKKDSLALEIVKEVVDCQERVNELYFPMTRDQDKLKAAWEEASQEIVNLLQQGKDVAFITLGDPLLYSTYIYILKKIKTKYPKIDLRTIPGITSVNAASSRLNLPLTEGDEKIAIVPATSNLEELEDILSKFSNVVLMKVSKNYDALVDLLTELDLKDNATFISRCGQEIEFITSDLDSLVGEKIDYLSMIIVKASGKCEESV